MRDLPCGPAVKKPLLPMQEVQVLSAQGAKIPHAVGRGQKKANEIEYAVRVTTFQVFDSRIMASGYHMGHRRRQHFHHYRTLA